jgi:hypothetical protein
MMIVGFGEFIDTADGQQSLFARVRMGSGHEFDLPLMPVQLEILKTQLQAEGGVEVTAPAAPQAVPTKVAAVPPPQLLRKVSGDAWGDDDDEPEGFQLAHSVEDV